MKVGQADPCETEPLAPMKVPISEVFQSRRFMSRKDLAQIDAAIDQEAFLPPEPLPRLDEVEEEEDEACVQDKLFISTDEGANDEQRQQQQWFVAHVCHMSHLARKQSTCALYVCELFHL